MMKYYVVAIMCFAAVSQAAPQKRLTGGTDVTTNDFPWVGSLQQRVPGRWKHICGCALLFDQVDTAAHCYPTSANINSYRVVYRTNDLANTQATIIPILSSTRDPQFGANGPGFSYDFIRFQITGQSTRIFTRDPIRQGGVQCQVFGWRRTSACSEPTLLHNRTVTTISTADCQSRVSSLGATISNRDTCVEGDVISEGDSGNPLLCSSSIRGVASWSAAGVSIFTADASYLG